jgi:hypothetical protein
MKSFKANKSLVNELEEQLKFNKNKFKELRLNRIKFNDNYLFGKRDEVENNINYLEKLLLKI